MNVKEKHPYDAPTLMVVSIASAKLFASSGDPEVKTSSTKVDPNAEALTKESNSVWDEDW